MFSVALFKPHLKQTTKLLYYIWGRRWCNFYHVHRQASVLLLHLSTLKPYSANFLPCCWAQVVVYGTISKRAAQHHDASLDLRCHMWLTHSTCFTAWVQKISLVSRHYHMSAIICLTKRATVGFCWISLVGAINFRWNTWDSVLCLVSHVIEDV